MVRKTRRHSSSKKVKGIYSIPELRRSFEHIEEYVDKKIALKESKEQLIKDLRKEWSKVFLKELDKKSADAFVCDRMSKKHSSRHRTARRHGGAGSQLANTATPIAGAPLDYTTRAGIYLAPGQIPDKAGHLPLSDGSKSSFGSYVQYVDKGFWNPEPGQSYDPVPGQPPWPVPPVGMGSNAVHFANKGGSRNRTRKARRGGGILDDIRSLLPQIPSRPIPSSSPPGVLQDAQDYWYGKSVGPSPDQVQRGLNYQIGSVYPKPVTF
jgi:hypothetical protein